MKKKKFSALVGIVILALSTSLAFAADCEFVPSEQTLSAELFEQTTAQTAQQAARLVALQMLSDESKYLAPIIASCRAEAVLTHGFLTVNDLSATTPISKLPKQLRLPSMSPPVPMVRGTDVSAPTANNVSAPTAVVRSAAAPVSVQTSREEAAELRSRIAALESRNQQGLLTPAEQKLLASAKAQIEGIRSARQAAIAAAADAKKFANAANGSAANAAAAAEDAKTSQLRAKNHELAAWKFAQDAHAASQKAEEVRSTHNTVYLIGGSVFCLALLFFWKKGSKLIRIVTALEQSGFVCEEGGTYVVDNRVVASVGPSMPTTDRRVSVLRDVTQERGESEQEQTGVPVSLPPRLQADLRGLLVGTGRYLSYFVVNSQKPFSLYFEKVTRDHVRVKGVPSMADEDLPIEDIVAVLTSHLVSEYTKGESLGVEVPVPLLAANG